MNLPIQEPLIYQRLFSHDLPCENQNSYYKYVAMWIALDVLSLYRPIIPSLTLKLNVIRSLPTFSQTFSAIMRGESIKLPQMARTAYYASIIGLTVINPVYGLLAINIDSILLPVYQLYCEPRNNPVTIKQMAMISFTLVTQIVRVSLFFTSNPTLIALSLAPRALINVSTIIKRLTTENKDPNDPNYIEIPISLFQLAISYYRYNSAMNLISEMANQGSVDANRILLS